MRARSAIAALAVVAATGFAVPALAIDGSVDADGLPGLPQRPCHHRTETMCKVVRADDLPPKYRIIDDGWFCMLVIRDDGDLYEFYCAHYWPFVNPVVNARLKDPDVGGPHTWRVER
jgi:hypothetical protein